MNEQQDTIDQLKSLLREVASVLHSGWTEEGDQYYCFFCGAEWDQFRTEWHEDGCVMLRIDEVLNGNE